MEITDLFTLLSGPTSTQHEGWGLFSVVVTWLCIFLPRKTISIHLQPILFVYMKFWGTGLHATLRNTSLTIWKLRLIPTPLAAHNCWPLCLWLSGRFRGSDPIWRWQPGGRSLWYNTPRAPLITRRKHKQTDKRSRHSSFSMQPEGWASFTPVTACYQRKQFLERWLFLHNPACRVILWPCVFSLGLFKSGTPLRSASKIQSYESMDSLPMACFK